MTRRNLDMRQAFAGGHDHGVGRNQLGLAFLLQLTAQDDMPIVRMSIERLIADPVHLA
ncbi:MAG: hypothetical protein OXG15_03200 [Gammaproteobacteria bacterium]|nr:hypothetical protein [Gammaproteobacteria bacterium]